MKTIYIVKYSLNNKMDQASPSGEMQADPGSEHTPPPPVVNFDCITLVCLIVVNMQCLHAIYTKPASKQSPDPKNCRAYHAGTSPPCFEIPGSATVYMCIAKWLEYLRKGNRMNYLDCFPFE